jgi:hypothetical protein
MEVRMKPYLLLATSAALVAALITPARLTAEDDDFHGEGRIKHVLLLSIDGMHAVDFLNCANGITGVNGGEPYCPNLAALGHNAINYTAASTSKPSDSFPGLMTIVTGATPKTMGVYYDVAYDRSLDPPAKTTGNGVAGGTCIPFTLPTGTTTEFEEGIDRDCGLSRAPTLKAQSQRLSRMRQQSAWDRYSMAPAYL